MTEPGTYSLPARTPPDGWKPFGWQGLTCLIPESWDVSGIDGSNRNGYFTFDDERVRRMEVKFDLARRLGKPQLKQTLEDYFKAVRKELRKGAEFEVDHELDLTDEGSIPKDYDYRTYGWTSEMIGRGIIWHCPTCGRVVIAQCLAEKNRVNLREMSQVLTSFRCHTDTDKNLWAVFDYAVDVPAEFQLEQNKLQAGLTSLTFSHKSRRIVVDRIGLVQAILKHKAIDDYVKTIHYKKLKRRRLRFIEEAWRGFPGFRIDGERFRLFYFIPFIGPWLRKLRKSDHIGGRLWHSEAANRLYIIRTEGREPQQVADMVAESVVAHEARAEER